MIFGLCIGVATWALFFFGHLATMRIAAPVKRARIDQILFGIGFLTISMSTCAFMIIFGSSIWTHGGPFMGMLWGFLTYAALFAVYMPFFYAVTASLSGCTIVLIAKENDKGLPIAVLFKDFASQALVAARLRVMAQHGLLLPSGSEFRLTRRGMLLAQMFAVLKRFWRLDPGG